MSKPEGDSGLDSQISSQPQQNDSFDRTQLYEGMSALSRSSETGLHDRAGDSGSLNFNTNELYKGLDSGYQKDSAGSGAIDFSPPPVSGAHGQSEIAGQQQESSLPPMAGAELQGEPVGQQQESSLPPTAGAELPGEPVGQQQESSLPPMAGSDLQHSAGASPGSAYSPALGGTQDVGTMPGSPSTAGQAEQGVMHPAAQSGNAIDGQSEVASANQSSGLAGDGHSTEGRQFQNAGSVSTGSGFEMPQYAAGSPLSVDGPGLAGAQDTGAMNGASLPSGNAELGNINSGSNPGLESDTPISGSSLDQSFGHSGDGQRLDTPDVQTAGVSLPSLSSSNVEGTMSPRERSFQSWSGHVAQPTEGAHKSAQGDGVEPQRSAEVDAGDAGAIKSPGDKAKELIDAAKIAEPRITDDLQKLAGENGGQMVGLEHRLKSEESMTRKISDGYPAERVVDALRYTMVFPPEKLADGVQKVREGMQADGYNEIKLNNSYEDSRFYKGINAAYEKDGQKFELQFHTPQSFDIKNGDNHKLYEVTRELLRKDEDGKNTLKEKPQIDEVLNKHMAVLERYPNLAEMSKNFLSAAGTIAEAAIRSLASHIMLRATQQQIKNYASMVMPDNISSITNVDRRK